MAKAAKHTDAGAATPAGEAVELDARALDDLVERAETLIAQKDWGAALGPLSVLIERSVWWEWPYMMRGQAFSETGNPPAALADFNRAVEVKPTNRLTWEYRARFRVKQQKFGSAIPDFDMAIALFPEEAELWYARGMAHLWNRNEDAALSDLNECLRLDPDYQAAYWPRSSIKDAKGDLAGARADTDRANRIKTAPEEYYSKDLQNPSGLARNEGPDPSDRDFDLTEVRRQHAAERTRKMPDSTINEPARELMRRRPPSKMPGYVEPGKKGKAALAVWVNPELRDQVNQTAALVGMTAQQFMTMVLEAATSSQAKNVKAIKAEIAREVEQENKKLNRILRGIGNALQPK